MHNECEYEGPIYCTTTKSGQRAVSEVAAIVTAWTPDNAARDGRAVNRWDS